jgi:preprotein translocase subunit SecF
VDIKNMNFNFLKYSKIYIAIAIIAVVASIVALGMFGLKMGIDLEGGTSLTVNYSGTRPSADQIKVALNGVDEANDAQIQAIGKDGMIIKINKKDVSSTVYNSIIEKLKTTGTFDESSVQLQTISPQVGGELKGKAIIVALAALLVMLLYIAFAFKNVSKPISSFQYGFASTITLFHDLIIPLGILAVLGKYFDAQLTIPVITALLTIVGYCINNTVVVFDRVRENLSKDGRSSYAEIVNKSLNETLARCVNTSLAVLIALAPLYYFFSNEEDLKYFTLIMGIGVVIGIFSSVLLASPILVYWNEWKQKKAKVKR